MNLLMSLNDDVIVSHIEDEDTIVNSYNRHLIRQYENVLSKYNISLDTKCAFNTGIMCFNNQEIKDKFIDTYIKCVKELSKIILFNVYIPDLVLEQLHLFQLYPNAKTIIKDYKIWCKEANELGFVHFISSYKFKDEIFNKIINKFNEQLEK